MDQRYRIYSAIKLFLFIDQIEFRSEKDYEKFMIGISEILKI